MQAREGGDYKYQPTAFSMLQSAREGSAAFKSKLRVRIGRHS